MRKSRGGPVAAPPLADEEDCRMAQVPIRLLSADDAPAYREIRLEALRLHPAAYSSTFEGEAAHELAWFAERLRGSSVFAAFDGAHLVGTAGLRVLEGGKVAHKAVLWGIYVRPGTRKGGIGRSLAEAVIDHARARVELIQLSVVRGNDAARRLYASLGFVEYGIEQNAFKQAGVYYDDVLMAKDLRHP
jgi:ribosomal protein S18 acetylase RimI-like enzyme